MRPKYRSDGSSRSSRVINRVYMFLQRSPAKQLIPLAKRAHVGILKKVADVISTSRLVGIVQKYPGFAPGSRGPYPVLSRMTLETIGRIAFDLAALAKLEGSRATRETILNRGADFEDEVGLLGAQLEKHGSDKVRHGYHRLYAELLSPREDVRRILEIGLGTNNEDTVSHMTINGRPGASLRAFRDFCPQAEIFGADIDSRILFEEERVKTFQVNQLNYESLDTLEAVLPGNFDLVIDDGLHAPDANIATLIMGMRLIKPGGWVVIEDIKPAAEAIWEVVSALLPSNFEAHIIQANFELVFAVRRDR